MMPSTRFKTILGVSIMLIIAVAVFLILNGGSSGEFKGWKTYRHRASGDVFRFKHPPNFSLSNLPQELQKEYFRQFPDIEILQLVDETNGCYLGPIQLTGLSGSTSNKPRSAVTKTAGIQISSWSWGENTKPFFISAALSDRFDVFRKDSLANAVFNLVPLGSPMILDKQFLKAGQTMKMSVNDQCLADFDKILSTFEWR